ncbi:hypothetical protein Taro_039935 [Colocasia esculenta]|uniref:Uncharacterized protein n=1 Tax=Colocasia esculenta TaxID=4460 RepID=A0A843WX34_COLES|nr:hypothetical protein [Colocasia esculenta]
MKIHLIKFGREKLLKRIWAGRRSSEGRDSQTTRRPTWAVDRFDLPLVDSKWTIYTGRSRRTGEEDELGMLDLLLSNHQELLHMTPESSDTTKLSRPENYAADINNTKYNSRRYPEM